MVSTFPPVILNVVTVSVPGEFPGEDLLNTFLASLFPPAKQTAGSFGFASG